MFADPQHPVAFWRQKQHLSLDKLAERVDISREWLWKLEHGANGSREVMEKIAKALSVSLQDLGYITTEDAEAECNPHVQARVRELVLKCRPRLREYFAAIQEEEALKEEFAERQAHLVVGAALRAVEEKKYRQLERVLSHLTVMSREEKYSSYYTYTHHFEHAWIAVAWAIAHCLAAASEGRRALWVANFIESRSDTNQEGVAWDIVRGYADLAKIFMSARRYFDAEVSAQRGLRAAQKVPADVAKWFSIQAGGSSYDIQPSVATWVELMILRIMGARRLGRLDMAVREIRLAQAALRLVSPVPPWRGADVRVHRDDLRLVFEVDRAGYGAGAFNRLSVLLAVELDRASWAVNYFRHQTLNSHIPSHQLSLDWHVTGAYAAWNRFHSADETMPRLLEVEAAHPEALYRDWLAQEIIDHLLVQSMPGPYSAEARRLDGNMKRLYTKL